jgi:hypothetical protein
VYKLPLKKKYSFSSLSKILDELHFSTGTKEGIVITSANLLQHGSFGYIIFGRDKKKALDIERKMIGILNN